MKTIVILIFILVSSVCFADQKALTDTGKEVILYNDGTWKYSGKSEKAVVKTETSKEKFKKPEDSGFMLKSTKNKSAFWINTNKWTFKKPEDNSDAEYEFQLKGEDLYGMAISEGVHIPLDSLADIALENARDAAPDAKITKREYRLVNGIKVLYIEMKGTMKGIKFMYLGYYYSDESGSTQYVVYTGSNLVSKYKLEIENFLNGLGIQ